MSKGTIICLCDFTGVMAEPWSKQVIVPFW